MKIFSIPTINSINRINTVCFRGVKKPLKYDVFEKSNSKTVQVKNRAGKKVDAVIVDKKPKTKTEIEEGYGSSIIYAEGMPAGSVQYMNSYNDSDIYIGKLNTKEYKKGRYRGLGTELIKHVAQMSKERGFEGKISVTASNNPEPFVFYYKNNFKPLHKPTKLCPAIEYAARKNIPIEKVLPNQKGINMILSENGANALLAGKRQMDDHKFITVYKNKKMEANLILCPESNEKYFQIVNSKTHEQLFSAGIELQDETMVLYDIINTSQKNKIEDFLQSALYLAAYELGVQEVATRNK